MTKTREDDFTPEQIAEWREGVARRREELFSKNELDAIHEVVCEKMDTIFSEEITMGDVKPRFFISHDEGGLHLWLSRVRPKKDFKSKRYSCAEGTSIRLPYSWFGYFMREGSSVEVPIEDAIVKAVDSNLRRKGYRKST